MTSRAPTAIGSDDRGCQSGSATATPAQTRAIASPAARTTVATTAVISRGRAPFERGAASASPSNSSHDRRPMPSGIAALAGVFVAQPSGPWRPQWAIQRSGTSPQNTASTTAAAISAPMESQPPAQLSPAAEGRQCAQPPQPEPGRRRPGPLVAAVAGLLGGGLLA